MKQWKEVLPVLCSDRMYTALNDLEAFSSKYGILPKLDYALDMFSMVLPQNVRVVFVAHPRTRARAGGDGHGGAAPAHRGVLRAGRAAGHDRGGPPQGAALLRCRRRAHGRRIRGDAPRLCPGRPVPEVPGADGGRPGEMRWVPPASRTVTPAIFQRVAALVAQCLCGVPSRALLQCRVHFRTASGHAA